MLYKAKTLKGYALHSRDGDVGSVKEFYFDDRHWAIRYLVANAGDWLTGRQVLISPYALGAVDDQKRRIVVDLTKHQIENSPPLDSDKPVSRQFEDAYHQYYAWPSYYGGPFMWGAYETLDRNHKILKESGSSKKGWDSHLRSTTEVSGYHIHAKDGAIGHVEDFLIDDALWAIRYLIVDTRNWCPGKKVLVSPRWIERVSWDKSEVFVDVSRASIKKSPEYSEASAVTREHEIGLHQHYGRQGYWPEEAVADDFRNKLSARGIL